MHPATLHGVGVITKLYFAIFAASDLESRQEVLQGHRCWYQYIFLLAVNSNLTLSCTVLEIWRQMSKIDNFPYLTPIPAKIWGCSLENRSVVLGCTESEKAIG